MILGSQVVKRLDHEIINEIGTTLISLVEQFFKIEGRNDVAFTAVSAIATINEAPIQVEIRYTAGRDEYGQGKPFDPSEEEQELLASLIMGVVQGLTLGKYKVSVWCKPYHNSVFKDKPV